VLRSRGHHARHPDAALLGLVPVLPSLRARPVRPPAGVIVEDGEVYFPGRAREGSTASARHEVEAVLWLRPDEIVPAELAFPTTRAAFTR
jgi:hypothetical protein